MSFIDKAKQKIKGVPKMLGEETVRIVNYDDAPEKQPQSEAPSSPEPEIRSAPKEKKATPSKIERPVLAKKNAENSSGGTAFNIEEKISFFSKKKKHDAIDEAAEELVKVDQSKIKDVLEILEIPATFEIGREIFLPEDIAEVEFDYQTPHGFDMGQVEAFVTQARDSLTNYVKLLKLRNEHVAKLATVVDRLQVDLNNQRFDSEIANGINIMPTQDDDDLNNQNMELKLLNMRLREELAALKSSDSLSTDERQAFEDLQDQLSIVSRECESLREANYELKTKVSFMEEDLGVDPVEDEKAFTSGRPISNDDDEEDLEYNDFSASNSLPDFGASELPNFEDDSETDNAISSNDNSAFFVGEDLTLDEFIKENQDSYDGENEEDDGDFSMIEIMGETPPPRTEIKPEVEPEFEPEFELEVKSSPRIISIFDEDEDDELEAIMKQEFGEN